MPAFLVGNSDRTNFRQMEKRGIPLTGKRGQRDIAAKTKFSKQKFAGVEQKSKRFQ